MKKSREFFIHLAVFAALNLICDLCYGVETTDTQGKKIESVLDKLEKRLIDREASPFTEDEDLAIKKGVGIRIYIVSIMSAYNKVVCKGKRY